MNINLIADNSVSSAPVGFVAAVQAAAAVYDAAFPGNYTVNIRYGWNTYDNQADDDLTLSPSTSLGGVESGSSATYAQVKTWLKGDVSLFTQTSAYAYLPASYLDLPNDADDFFVSSAQEKALGVYTGSTTAIDGAIGFGTQTTDWEGLALTEIAHALGWLSGDGSPTIADLFRYASKGQFAWTGGQGVQYFSVNGGASSLANFDIAPYDGVTDFTLFAGPGSDILDFPQEGTVTTLSALDLVALDVVGFGGAGLSGPGQTVALASLPNATAFLENTQGGWDTVNGSNGTVDLTSAATGVFGGGDTINFIAGTGNVAALFNTNGAPDTVNGSGGVVELNGSQAQVFGDDDTTYFVSGTGNVVNLFYTNGGWDGVSGSNGVVGLYGAKAAIFGVDTINLNGGGDVAALFNTNGAWDGVYGSHQILELNSAKMVSYGDDNIVYFSSGAGDVAAIFNTNGQWDSVNGSNGVVELNNAKSIVTGADDFTYFASGSNDVAALYNTGATWDGVAGSFGVVELNNARSAVFGAGDSILLSGGTGNVAALYNTGAGNDIVSGSNGIVELNAVTSGIYGDDNTVYFNGGGNTAYMAGTGESFSFQQTFGMNTIYGYVSDDTLVFPKSDFGTLLFYPVGANTIITNNATNVLTIENIQITSLKITYQ